MISENLVLPFRTKVLGREVSVTETVLGEDVRILAICEADRARQRVSARDLPVPRGVQQARNGSTLIAFGAAAAQAKIDGAKVLVGGRNFTAQLQSHKSSQFHPVRRAICV